MKCNYRHYDKKCEFFGIKYDLIESKCLCSNKNCHQMFDEKLNEQFFNT